jgi:iron complex outermembrane receptor protein
MSLNRSGRKIRLIVTVAIGSVVTATAIADDSEHDLEEIIVTASPLGSVIQAADVLDEDDLLVRGTSSVGELLAGEPGVSSSYFGPAASQPIIRGMGGGRVSVLTDRVSSLDASDASPDHAVSVEPILAEKVEVIRGPAALIYGSAAWGGVVNVLDGRIPQRRAEKSLQGLVEIRGDTAAGERAIVGRLDGGQGPLAWHIDGYGKQTNDLQINGFATADPAARSNDEVPGVLENSYSDAEGHSIGMTWFAGDSGFLGLAMSKGRSEYGLPGPAENEGEQEPELFPGPWLSLDQDRLDLRGEWRTAATWESIKFAVGKSDYRHTEVEPSGDVGTVFLNDAWQARIDLSHRTIAGFSGAIGLMLDGRDFSAVGDEAFIPRTDSSSVGLFILEERHQDWGQLQIGARVESAERSAAEEQIGYDATAVSLAAGLRRQVGDDSHLVLNITRTQRHPGVEELFSNGAHVATRQFEVGLVPGGAAASKETANGIEAGYHYHLDNMEWALTVYRNHIDNYIYQSLDGSMADGLPVAVYAQATAFFSGFEAEFSVNRKWSDSVIAEIRLFSDFVRAELSGGARLPRIPPGRLGAELHWLGDRWALGVDAIWHADQRRISSFETDSFTLLGAHLVYDIEGESTGWQLFLRASNILDEAGRRASSVLAAYAPLPGRSLHAGVRLRF